MEHFGTDSMLFPIWPNGLAQTLVAIKRSPLILSKGLDGFTVLLQTADGAGRVHPATPAAGASGGAVLQTPPRATVPPLPPIALFIPASGIFSPWGYLDLRLGSSSECNVRKNQAKME